MLNSYEDCINFVDEFIKNNTNDAWLQNNLEVLSWGYDFMAEYGCTEEVGHYVTTAFTLKQNDDEINLDRVEDLYNTLLDDPDLLAQCIEGKSDFDLQTYEDLLNLEVPQEIIDLLGEYSDALPDLPGHGNPRPIGFQIQSIEQGNSGLVSMDYYPVEIVTMPDTNGDGIPDSQEELYQAIRANFIELASGEIEDFISECFLAPPLENASWEFEPYFGDTDSLRWVAQDIGAMFFIEADAVSSPIFNIAAFFADDGAVITTQETDCCWIFSTIHTPRSGTQPLAGNRQFGIRTNSNGNLEFYTRAIDRARVTDLLNIYGALEGECDADDYFDIGVATWANLQQNVYDYIIEHGGEAILKESSSVRMDFAVVYDKLKSDMTVDFVTCN